MLVHQQAIQFYLKYRIKIVAGMQTAGKMPIILKMASMPATQVAPTDAARMTATVLAATECISSALSNRKRVKRSLFRWPVTCRLISLHIHLNMRSLSGSRPGFRSNFQWSSLTARNRFAYQTKNVNEIYWNWNRVVCRDIFGA